jgi:molybdate transport system permease protein
LGLLLFSFLLLTLLYRFNGKGGQGWSSMSR